MPPTNKPCKKGYIVNPATNRCVKADGKIGMQVLAAQKPPKVPAKQPLRVAAFMNQTRLTPDQFKALQEEKKVHKYIRNLIKVLADKPVELADAMFQIEKDINALDIKVFTGLLRGEPKIIHAFKDAILHSLKTMSDEDGDKKVHDEKYTYTQALITRLIFSVGTMASVAPLEYLKIVPSILKEEALILNKLKTKRDIANVWDVLNLKSYKRDAPICFTFIDSSMEYRYSYEDIPCHNIYYSDMVYPPYMALMMSALVYKTAQLQSKNVAFNRFLECHKTLYYDRQITVFPAFEKEKVKDRVQENHYNAIKRYVDYIVDGGSSHLYKTASLETKMSDGFERMKMWAIYQAPADPPAWVYDPTTFVSFKRKKDPTAWFNRW